MQRSLHLWKNGRNHVAQSRSSLATNSNQIERKNNESKLDFNDCQKAFMAKSTPEIIRALTVYRLCSYNKLVENNQVVSQF